MRKHLFVCVSVWLWWSHPLPRLQHPAPPPCSDPHLQHTEQGARATLAPKGLFHVIPTMTFTVFMASCLVLWAICTCLQRAETPPGVLITKEWSGCSQPWGCRQSLWRECVSLLLAQWVETWPSIRFLSDCSENPFIFIFNELWRQMNEKLTSEAVGIFLISNTDCFNHVCYETVNMSCFLIMFDIHSAGIDSCFRSLILAFWVLVFSFFFF